jgi:hypothetical protein
MKTRTSQPDIDLDNLRARQSELHRRLMEGDLQISVAKRDGTDTTRWENHWITLLREYEAVCRTLAEQAPDRYPVAA